MAFDALDWKVDLGAGVPGWRGDFENVTHGDIVPVLDNKLANFDFSTLTVHDPMVLSDWKAVIGNPSMSYNPSMTALAVEDTGSPHGRSIKIHLDANAHGGSSGLTAYPPLKRAVEYASIEYWVRFRAGFEWSGGGKLPGLGGYISPLAKPPTGGVPSIYGWSSRFMWLKDAFGGNLTSNDEIIGYLYAPYQTAGAYGQNRHTNTGLGGDGTYSSGLWHKIKQIYKMNTVTAEGSTSPSTDGIHEIWVDGVRRYQKLDEVYRYYSAVKASHVLFDSFRGGADSGWDASADSYIDIVDLVIEELS